MSKSRKTAIITGASGGIGHALAKTFAGDDYNVVLTGTNAERLALTETAIGSPDTVLSVIADVGVAADRDRLVDSAVARFGRIDVLINNAGIFEPRPFLEVDEAHLDRLLTVNMKGVFFLTQAVIPHLKKAGGGAVINIGTVLVDHAVGGFPATAAVASKGAIHALSRQLAAEFGKDNISVNVIAPGIIRSPLHARNGIDNADDLAGLHLLGRIGEPEEVADVALLLAKNPFMTGTVVNVDGGHVAGHVFSG